MCSHVKEVSTGQSPGSGHPLPADGTRLITHHQLLLFHQSEPGRRWEERREREIRTAGGEGGERGGKGKKKGRRGREKKRRRGRQKVVRRRRRRK